MQALEQTTVGETVVYQALCGLCLGEAQLLYSCLEKAHALAERALTLAQAHQERGHQAYTLRLLGEIAAHRNPPEVEQAEAFYRQAPALADELGMHSLLAHCHFGLGILYNRTGRPEQTRTELSASNMQQYGMDAMLVSEGILEGFTLTVANLFAL
jgi:tetratricopeptide (TPR) repeat protein